MDLSVSEMMELQRALFRVKRGMESHGIGIRQGLPAIYG